MLTKIKAKKHIILMILTPIALGGFIFAQNNMGKTSSVTISDIVANPSFGRAEITWATNQAVLGKIEYGPTDTYGYEWPIDMSSVDRLFSSSVRHVAGMNRFDGSRDVLGDTVHFRVSVFHPETKKMLARSADQTVTFYPVTQEPCRQEVRVPEDYQHIQPAIYRTCIGGTVFVGPGVYKESISAFAINLIGAGASKTKIIGRTAASGGVSMSVDATTVSGFTIESDYVADDMGQTAMSTALGTIGVVIGGGKASIITNNVFTNSDTGLATDLLLGPYGLHIANNTFVGGKGQDYGIAIGIRTPSSAEIGSYMYGAGSKDVDIVENNAIVNYQEAGIKMFCHESCDGIEWDKTQIRYNNMWGNRQDYEIVKRVGWLPGQLHGLAFRGLVAPDRFILHEVHGLSPAEANQTGKNGNISKDPLFLGAVVGDYHEKTGSPHVDAGNPSSDYSNEPAPNGGRINIGAYGNTTEATQSQ